MKKNILLSIITLFLALSSFAQTDENNGTQNYPAPKWVSDMGYWIIENNIKSPDKSIVYFYNNDNVLVYKEKVEGMVINLNKRKVKMNLKKVLEQSVHAYQHRHIMAENEMWVANIIKR